MAKDFEQSVAGPAPRRMPHVPALDGIRLLAVTFVIFHHLTAGSKTSVFLHLMGLQRGNGIGPSLFFILSGLLLTGVIISTRNSQDRYKNFMIRRCLRIFPLYYLYLAIVVIATAVFSNAPIIKYWVFAVFLQSNFASIAAQTGNVLPAYHLWNLGLQEQFYLVWPLIIWACKTTRQMRYVCWSLIVFSLLARLGIPHFLFPWGAVASHTLPARANELSFGALLALERIQLTRLTGALRKLFLPALAGSLYWMWIGLDFERVIDNSFGLLLVTIACAGFVILASDPSTLISRVLGWKPIATAGKDYSFPIYIFHPAMLTIVGWLHLPKAVTLTIFFIATLSISVLSYHFFESRFLNIRRKTTKTSAHVPTPANA